MVASDDGFVRFYDPSLDKVYWERRLNASIYASLVVDRDRRRVVVATTSGAVAALDLRGGVAWATKTSVPIFATPTILPTSALLMIAGFNSRCIGIGLERGEITFDRPLPPPWHRAYGGSASHRDPYASPAATTDGRAIFCSGEAVIAVSAEGKEDWRCEIGDSIKSSPVVLHQTGEVAVCAVDGRCIFLDAASGSVARETHLGAKVTASGAVSGSVLVVANTWGSVTAFDIGTRDVIWTSAHGGPRSYTSFTVLPSGDFVATAESGNVVCLQRDTGRLLWETSQVLGLPDHDPALDITPVAATDGNMYGGSYSGFIYRFAFRRQGEGPV